MRKIYDDSVDLWVELLHKFTEAADLIDADKKMKKTMKKPAAAPAAPKALRRRQLVKTPPQQKGPVTFLNKVTIHE